MIDLWPPLCRLDYKPKTRVVAMGTGISELQISTNTHNDTPRHDPPIQLTQFHSFLELPAELRDLI
jgi:hypothetical protein